MSKIKIVQIAMAATNEEWDTQYLDDKGRVWTIDSVPDEDKCEYDELGRKTKSVFKQVWKQVDLPAEPTTAIGKGE